MEFVVERTNKDSKTVPRVFVRHNGIPDFTTNDKFTDYWGWEKNDDQLVVRVDNDELRSGNGGRKWGG